MARSVKVVQLLLEGGADPSTADSCGRTPLMEASGSPEVLRLLLERALLLERGGPDVLDAVDPKTTFTAFHFSCINNHPDCAEALARAGCDVGLKTREGNTGRELAKAVGPSPGRHCHFGWK